MVSSPDRTALLVVRVWIESDPVTGFRARVIRSLDLEGREDHESTLASPDAVLDVVRDWLAGITDAGSVTGPGDAPVMPG